MKAVVAAFNQEKALVGAFSVITKFRMDLFEALADMLGHEMERDVHNSKNCVTAEVGDWRHWLQ